MQWQEIFSMPFQMRTSIFHSQLTWPQVFLDVTTDNIGGYMKGHVWYFADLNMKYIYRLTKKSL